jgi:hypothetical protein
MATAIPLQKPPYVSFALFIVCNRSECMSIPFGTFVLFNTAEGIIAAHALGTPLRGSLVVGDSSKKRAVDVQFAVGVDEAQLPKLVREYVDPRPS